MRIFIKEVCSLPWDTMEFGAVETIADDGRSIRCNHVYIGCQTPFLVAAESIDLSTGAESFGVTVLRDLAAIRRFIEGPYPPHNQPLVSSLQQLVGKPSEVYLKGHKEPRIILAADGAQQAQALVIEGDGLRIRIAADDGVPMALLVSWWP